MKRITREEMAMVYAIVVLANPNCPNVEEINAWIIGYWSATGLKWIKERAWELFNKAKENYLRLEGMQ